MRTGFSAYLSIFNDWEILPDAMRSIAPFVEEIVLVDGAYVWMARYFESLGIDPGESDIRVRSAAEACGVPVRFVTGLWNNEVEKRIAGYEACTTRYVFRIDADEVMQVHEDALQRFVQSGSAVAAMHMPICATPELITVHGPRETLDRQCLLFDRLQISAEAHLHYLWLVLGPEPLPDVTAKLPPIFSEAIAFNHHLTAWRTPATSRFRAAFYTLNYARTKGLPWTGWGRDTPVRDLSVLLSEFVTPSVYQDLQLTGSLVVGDAELKNRSLRRSPIEFADRARAQLLYAGFLESLAALNQDTARTGRHFVNGDYILFDLTTEAAATALGTPSNVTLGIADQPRAAVAKLYEQRTEAPWETLTDVPFTLEADSVTLQLPQTPSAARLFAECCACKSGARTVVRSIS